MYKPWIFTFSQLKANATVNGCQIKILIHTSFFIWIVFILTKPNLQRLQRNDRAMIRPMSGRKTLSPPGSMSYLCGLALRIWTSFWRREDSDGMDMWNAPMVQSRQPLTYRLMESMGLGGPKWYGSSWQRGIAESGSSRLSTLMIDIPGYLVWDLPCVQQASYLEGSPLIWMLPLYLHVNQKSDYDDDDDDWRYLTWKWKPTHTLLPIHLAISERFQIQSRQLLVYKSYLPLQNIPGLKACMMTYINDLGTTDILVTIMCLCPIKGYMPK